MDVLPVDMKMRFENKKKRKVAVENGYKFDNVKFEKSCDPQRDMTITA